MTSQGKIIHMAAQLSLLNLMAHATSHGFLSSLRLIFLFLKIALIF